MTHATETARREAVKTQGDASVASMAKRAWARGQFTRDLGHLIAAVEMQGTDTVNRFTASEFAEFYQGWRLWELRDLIATVAAL